MVKSLGFFFNVFPKGLYTILAPIKLRRILNLSISTCTISAESGGNVTVYSFHCAAHVGHFLFKNCFKVRIYGKGNFELVLSAMESHKKILFGYVYPNHFIVYTIFIVFVPGCLAVKSLEEVQAEVLLLFMATIAAPKYSNWKLILPNS